MRVVMVVIAVGCLLAAGASAKPPALEWAAAGKPSPGAAAAIGSPAAGCLQGAEMLPPEGQGYQVLRISRKRFFGHPATVRFVQDLAATAHAEGLGDLLIADMAQPRGGPMASGHGSHQTGLDVDVWFRLAERHLSAEELEAPGALSMVKANAIDAALWTPAQARLLELAARSPKVDRIFVNPVIKRHVCRTQLTGDRAWLAKLRPWWGHDEHFHVRLSCPEDDAGCEAQKPVPDGDGCGAELDSWFPRAGIPVPDNKPHHQARPLPASCVAVLRR
jgi:penicillin-insensitive murein DD-endopeptidase